MELRDLKDLCNTTEPEDKTMVYQKKCLCLFSFANNITSVHVFDRDEEFETPPEGKPSLSNHNVDPPKAASALGGDPADSNDSRVSRKLYSIENGDGGNDNATNNNADDEEEARELFVKNMDFLSPGSTTGSATSKEDDNSFGLVSTRFIRSKRLSTESAASDDNHDVTMDATAFSLHFRNLMRSSERTVHGDGNLKTPTLVGHTFDDNKSENSSQATGADSMVQMGFKNLIPQHLSSGRSNGGRDLNDMSLFVENPHKYDYGKLSPWLNELLAESQHTSVPNEVSVLDSTKSPGRKNKSSPLCVNTSEPVDAKFSNKEEALGAEGEPIFAEVLSDAITNPSDAGIGHGIVTTGHISSYHGSPNLKGPVC